MTAVVNKYKNYDIPFRSLNLAGEKNVFEGLWFSVTLCPLISMRNLPTGSSCRSVRQFTCGVGVN
jgi:hypothetical protein